MQKLLTVEKVLMGFNIYILGSWKIQLKKRKKKPFWRFYFCARVGKINKYVLAA